MSEDPSGEAGSEAEAGSEGKASPAAKGVATGDVSIPDDADDEEEWVPFEGLSDEGVLLVFAGLACVLAALTAASRGQSQPVVVFGGAAGVVALVVFVVDYATGHVPRLWVHLLVGGGATVAGAFALSAQHWVNAGTFGAAAALVLWRVVDVEVRGAD